MAALVKFIDTLEENAEVHFGVLLDNNNIVCMCCGCIEEEGDYEIVNEFSDDCWYYVDQALLQQFELM